MNWEKKLNKETMKRHLSLLFSLSDIRSIYTFYNDKEVEDMETILICIVYGFELLIGIAGIGMFGLILAALFDETSNEQAKRFARYMLNVNDEDFE